MKKIYLFALYCLAVAVLAAVPLSSHAATIEVYGGGGGGGSAGSSGGNGGSGGGGGLLNADGTLDGGGGGSGTGGGGGGGGIGGPGSFGFTGGAGGAGFGGGDSGGTGTGNSSGGKGGDATYTTADTSADSITITAGSGGEGGSNASGGAGGNVSLSLTGGTVTSGGTVAVTSGVAGGNFTNTGGTGGMASFTANTLIAPTINLVKKDGALTFNVGTLHVSQNTALALDNTQALDVSISGLAFANGSGLTVTQANGGTMTFGGNLSVAGSGNTLTSPIAFDASGKNLSFFLPASLTSGQTMLNVNGNADITGSMVSLSYQTVRPNIATGQSLTLLAATSLTADQTGLTVQTASGDIYTLQVNNNQLLAVLQQLSPTTPAYERLKAYAEGRTATLGFVNQGQDLILNQGFGSALFATRGPGFHIGTFAAGSGGWSRYNPGSHVDVSGASLLAGLAVGNDVALGRITLGAFFEGGWGNYTSHNSFSNYASAKGDGDTSYYGGGVLGRYDLNSGLLQGVYFDASARMGRAESDFSSNDIKYNGLKADFDSSSLYYGLHGGLGYQWQLNEKAMLDLSGKLLWTRQEGDNVNVHGDRLRFKDSDSLRTRLGGRFNYAVTEQFTPYAGAYWEHEFDGKARSTVNGNRIDAPTLEGNTGVGELGVSFKPVADSAFSMDFGVQGYTGVREGVTGSLQLKFEF